MDILKKYFNSIGRSSGIIYAGANVGQEIQFLKPFTDKIYAFEPINTPTVWGELVKHSSESVECYNYALSDSEGLSTFYMASNNGESSSLLKPGKHVSEFGYVNFPTTIEVSTKRLDSFDFYNTCDVLIMDVQGAELHVLNGISDFSNLKLIVAEYTSHDLYKDNCSVFDLHYKLYNEGFKLCETYDVYFNPKTKVTCGNVIFLRHE